MRRIHTLCYRTSLVLLFLLAFAVPVGAQAADEGDDALILFWGNGCPHCESEREFLIGFSKEFPDLEIREYEVWDNEENQRIFVETMAAIGREPRAVPTTLYAGQVWEGWNASVGEALQALATVRFAAPEAPTPATTTTVAEAETVDVPLVGEVEVESGSLLVSTLAIGFVDGFNPCSLWVLSMLLALVLHTGSRSRVFAVGLVFLTVTTALYGLYIIGAYSILSYVSYLTWVQLAVAAVALTFGVINVKDYFWFRTGPSLTISDSHKPKLYQRMRQVASSDGPLPRVLAGTAALAVGVSLIETPCTAGFPLLWADLLSEAGVGATAAVGLFSVYMGVFLLDELAVLAVAVVAMRAAKLQESQGRVLKLVGGLVMISLALVLVFQPELMESLEGVAIVFGGSILAALAIVAVNRAVLSRNAQAAPRPKASQRPSH